jgi:capsular polysaccharide biosynthesis protein
MSAGDVYRALWRHRVFILLATAAVGAAAWYGISRLAPTYEASTLVRVQALADPTNPAASLDASETLARTYAQVIDSGALDGRVRAILSRASGVRVSNVNLSASPVQDLALIWISAKSRVPEVAAKVADASPRALRAFASTSTTRDQIVTVRRADVPSSPTSPKKTLDLALAIVLALILNCGIALLLELLSDRVPDVDDMEESFGYPVLGTIPTLELVALNAANRPLRPIGPTAPGDAGNDVHSEAESTRG